MWYLNENLNETSVKMEVKIEEYHEQIYCLVIYW